MKSKTPLKRVEGFLPGLVIFLCFSLFSSLQYHSLLLEKVLGYSENEIGTLLMAGSLMNLGSPFWVRYFQKRIPKPGTIMSLNLLLLSALFVLFPLQGGFFYTLLIFCLLNLCVGSCFVLISTLLLFSVKDEQHGKLLFLRSIGTLGFALICLAGWTWGEHFEIQNFYNFYAILSLITGLLSLTVRGHIPSEKNTLPLHSIFQMLRRRTTLLLIATLALTNLSSFVASNLLGNFIAERFSLPHQYVSQAWTIATFAEIPLILFSIWLLKHTSLKVLLLGGMLLCSLRMILSAYAPHFEALLLAQIFHGFFYGVSLSAFGMYLKRHYPKNAIHSLNLFASIFISGLSSAAGGKIAGWLWSLVGLQQVYFLGGVLALLCALVLLFTVKTESIES